MQAWIVHVVIVFATAAITVALTPGRNEQKLRTAGIEHYLVSPLALWDGGWYLHIASQGYIRRQPHSPAFWPFYPLLLDIGQCLTTLPHAVVGVILSNAAFLVALVAMYFLVQVDYGRDVAVRAVWLASLSPLAFFFSAVYTEALFLALTVGALALAQSGRWTWAAIAAGLATVTRSTGVLIFFPLMILLIHQRELHPLRWWSRAIQLAAAAAMPLAYSAHLDRRWDDPLKMVHAQSGWGRTTSAPWDALSRAFHRAADVYLGGRGECKLRPDIGIVNDCRAGLQITINALSDDLSIVAVVIALAILPYAIWRLVPRDSLYLIVGILAPLMSPPTEDPLQSVARYMIVLFPIYIAIALLLRWRPLFVVTLVGSTIAMSGLLSIFAQGYFVA